MLDHKTAKAAPAFSADRSEGGLFFSGWCREGYWSDGILHKGKRSRPVKVSSETPARTHHKAHRTLRSKGVQSYPIPVFADLDHIWARL